MKWTNAPILRKLCILFAFISLYLIVRITNKTRHLFLLENNISQQSNTADAGTNESHQSNTTDAGTNESHQSNTTDAGTTESLSSSINNNTLQQSNAYYSCEYGNTTVTLPKYPHFIIAGVQKAGTTAISTALGDVNNFLSTNGREAHFWDRFTRLPKTSDKRCSYLLRYFNKWNSKRIQSDTIFFEKTPSLIAISAVPRNIVSLLPHKPKIIILLRDPVDRFYSHYKMTWRNSGINRPTFPSVEEYMKTALQTLNKNHLHAPPYSNVTTDWNQTDFTVGIPLNNHCGKINHGIDRGFYADQIKRFMKYFPIGESLKVIHYENFNVNKVAVLNDILKFIGVPSHEFDMKKLDTNLGPIQKVNSWFPPITNETRTYLKHVYKPFNDELANLLGESWRGVWD